MSIYTEHLKKAAGTVKKIMTDYDPESVGYAILPNDDYTMAVSAALDFTKKLPKRLVIVWKWTVTEGDLSGKSAFDRTMIDDENVAFQAKIARSRIETLGFTWPEDNIAELEKVIDEMNSAAVQAVVKVTSKPQEDNPEFVNYRFSIRDVIGSSVEDAPTETVEDAPAEEEPSTEENPLLDFCAAHGIEGVTAEHSTEEVVEALKDSGLKFPTDQLTDEETQLLESLDLAVLVEKAKVKPKMTLKKK